MDDPLYHFTSESNWSGIQSIDAIFPTSREKTPEDVFPRLYPNSFSRETDERLETVREEVRERSEFWNSDFVCAMPDPDIWAENGAFRDLIPYIQDDDGSMVGIEIPEDRIDSGYVVDLAPYSSRRFEGDLGYDPTVPPEENSQERNYSDTEYLVNRWMDVCLSVVPIEDYDGSYDVPEYWIGHPVDVKGLDSYRVTGNDLLSLESAEFAEM